MPFRLIQAVINENVGAVKQLLKEGADPNATEDADKITPLHFIAQKNSQAALEIAQLLLRAGADPFAKNVPNDQTPLDIAKMFGFAPMLSILSSAEDEKRAEPAPIRVLVNGARGKMGQEAVKAIQGTPGLMIAGESGKADDLKEMIATTSSQVVVDLTTASVAFNNASQIIEADAHPVIGTSGLRKEQVAELIKRCAKKNLGGLIIPNFSIGAVLVMRYARDCARYFPSVEIIELHHNKKADAPSGTALRTAELIAQVKTKAPVETSQEELSPGARGADHHGIPIHSIRLPGLLAHQAVMFGGVGETLTIRHDVSSREAYMPGLCLACRKVVTLDGLMYGLEHVL